MPVRKQLATNKRPNVAEWINYCCDGALREQALEFVEWVRGMGFKWKIHSTSNTGHNVFYNKVYMCKTLLYNDVEKDGNPIIWTIQPNLLNKNKYENEIVNENLYDLPRMRNYCRNIKLPELIKINNDCGCGICLIHPTVKNPNEEELNRIKRLLMLEKMSRQGV